MDPAHSNHAPARPDSPLGCLICAITLLSLLMAALLPTAGARAQDAEATQTQTPTSESLATGTPEILTDTPAVLTDTPAQAPSATTEDTHTPQAPTSTGPVAATAAAGEASPSPTSSATPQVETVTPGAVESQSNPACQDGYKTATIKLDGITVTICAPALPGDFIVPDPSSSDQVATAATLNPYHEFSITAIPYGLKVST